MPLSNLHINLNDDFSSKVMLAIREASNFTVHEVIEFINSNNRRRARINPIDTKAVDAKIFNYYLRKFDFQSLVINDKESLFKNLENVINNFEQDTDFIEKIKDVIKHTVNILIDEFEQEDLTYIPTSYDDLIFFSLDSNKLLSKIELKYFDEIQVKNETFESSLIQLDTFDNSLYNSIITNPSLIHSVNWREFEYLLAKILATFEYEVELQKGTKDGGIDIVAISKKGIMGDHKYLIQAKKWKNKVGIEPVQRLAFLKDHYDASKACLVTTSTFTKGAWELARMYPWQLELKDYNGLIDWIKLTKRT